MGDTNFIGINWGSSNFRAYLISEKAGIRDKISQPAGISSLTREGMKNVINALVEKWPNVHRIYAAGMIGSNIGWEEVPYSDCPTLPGLYASNLVVTKIDQITVHLVPGIACIGPHGEPDILRGEETEIFGSLQNKGDTVNGPHFSVLPGTHSKWVHLEDGKVVNFFTSMSGEIYDKLTASGVLASIVEGEAEVGDDFIRGIRKSTNNDVGIGSLLFIARSLVVRGKIKKHQASSYIRGILIGAEIFDAIQFYPEIRNLPLRLIGSEPVCRLYASALKELNIKSSYLGSEASCINGFLAIHKLSKDEVI